MTYDTTNFEFDNISCILKRFNNCFFKAFPNNINDNLKRFKDDKRLSNAVLVFVDSLYCYCV